MGEKEGHESDGGHEGHEGHGEEGSDEAPRHEGCCSSSGYEGHEGDEEEGRHEAPRHEGCCGSSGNEGHEGHEMNSLPCRRSWATCIYICISNRSSEFLYASLTCTSSVDTILL